MLLLSCAFCINFIKNFFRQELSSDSSQHVRSALASVIMGMAPVLGKVISNSINDKVIEMEVVMIFSQPVYKNGVLLSSILIHLVFGMGYSV